MPGPIWFHAQSPPKLPRLLTYDELAEFRDSEVRLPVGPGVTDYECLVYASVFALVPPPFRYRWTIASRDVQDKADAIIKAAEEAKAKTLQSAPEFDDMMPPKVATLPRVCAPWPAAWEHVGPSDMPALKSVSNTLRVLNEYIEPAAKAAGWTVPTLLPTCVAAAATNPKTWAGLPPTAHLFCLGGSVYLEKQDFMALPDPRAVFWGRYVEWRKRVNTPKPRRQSTLDIVAAARAWAEQKRAEGWTQKDFAKGLAEMLHITIGDNDEKSK